MLLTADDGTPAVTEYKYGKGRICFVACPIEANISSMPGAVSGDDAISYYKIYELLKLRTDKKCASVDSPYTCLTEHIVNEGERIVTILNHRPKAECVFVSLKDGYRLKKVMDVHGKAIYEAKDGGFDITVGANTGVVAVIEK